MRLTELARGLFDVGTQAADLEISGLAEDSRAVRPGDLFAAIPGARTDGRRFVSDALARGAAAVIVPVEMDAELPACAAPVFAVPDLRGALGALAGRLHGAQTARLAIVGVTGTKGKTSTTWILESILRKAGRSVALFGTIHNRIGDRILPSTNTTPSCTYLHEKLAEHAREGGTHAVLEVSSHGIDQGRVAGLRFAAGIFTNVAPEHLDYHGDFESYAATKARFFEGLAPDAHAILPREEAFSATIAERTAARVLWYGADALDGVEEARISPEGMSLRWKGLGIRTRLWGAHNLSNLLGAMTAAEALGVDRREVAEAVRTVVAPPGRLEEIAGGGPFRVFVDYAHTDGSLEKVLEALRPSTYGRIITVFGCGGDRDRLKRPRMGRVAERLSDHVVITSDNPRSEDPGAIIEDIAAGLERPEAAVFEVDRREAIALSLRMARQDDTVLIAGKGHETYQETRGGRHHFDDREVAREVLREMTS